MRVPAEALAGTVAVTVIVRVLLVPEVRLRFMPLHVRVFVPIPLMLPRLVPRAPVGPVKAALPAKVSVITASLNPVVLVVVFWAFKV